MSRWLLLCLPVLIAAGPARPDPVATLAGRYYEQFPNGTVDGDRYTGENIVEIVPVASDAAYIRASLSFFNGHSCGIYGVAEAEGDSLVYRDPKQFENGNKCELTVHRSGKHLSVRDNEGGCQVYCGARGGFASIALPFASRRPIRYMALLKRSRQYTSAMSAWTR